jgi:hypothetical protein
MDAIFGGVGQAIGAEGPALLGAMAVVDRETTVTAPPEPAIKGFSEHACAGDVDRCILDSGRGLGCVGLAIGAEVPALLGAMAVVDRETTVTAPPEPAI